MSPAGSEGLRRSLPRAQTSGTDQRIQAVVTDVDGTLFPCGTNPRVSERNQAALRRAVDSGVHVCLATGRIPGPWSDGIRDSLPGLGPGVFANGALVLGPDGELLEEFVLPREAVTAVLEYTQGGRASGGGRLSLLAAVRWKDAGPDYGSLRYLELAPDGPTWVTRLISSAGEPDVVLLQDMDHLRDYRVLKFVAFTSFEDDDWAVMPGVVMALRRALAHTGAVLVDCGPRQCEILPPGVNKGSGVLHLLNHLGNIPPESTMACGDAENDVEMLQLVGLGIAMGNAKPAAAAAADYMVATNDEDGVADAVLRFVLEEGA